MASNQRQSDGRSSGRNGGGGGGRDGRAPEWADGLKQLYDSVVEEQLPDSFKDLLDRLDQLGTAPGSNDNASSSPADRGEGR